MSALVWIAAAILAAMWVLKKYLDETTLILDVQIETLTTLKNVMDRLEAAERIIAERIGDL